MPNCPVCGGADSVLHVSASELESECRQREAFIQRRLARPASPEESKDLTDFFHGGKAEIRQCERCSLLLRREFAPAPTADYSGDEYDPAAMNRQYPRYVNAFRKKARPYRDLCPRGAHIVEIGSHYGAFLKTAAEWNWRAEGVDVGHDTTRFARGKGFTVHLGELWDARYPSSSIDGVFIWNCFEQIVDPAPLLRESKRILKPGGLLVLRTPNALFYSTARHLLKSPSLRPGVPGLLIDALGYNNLLGFPYQYGHRRETLDALAVAFGFQQEGMLNSEVIVFPLPDNPAWVTAEKQSVNEELEMRANSVLARGEEALIGPWIEVWFRSH